jgi:hypothetical protein
VAANDRRRDDRDGQGDPRGAGRPGRLRAGDVLDPRVRRQHGWVGIALDRVDREELAELVEEAWRMTAPKLLVRAFEKG